MPAVPFLRHSLSTRLLRLTICIVLAVEVLVFVPELTHERTDWLRGRIDDARIAALAGASDRTQPIDQADEAQLLQLSGAEWILLTRPGRPPMVLSGAHTAAPARTVVLGHEDPLTRTLDALHTLLVDRRSWTRLVDSDLAPPGTGITMVFPEHAETEALRHFAGDFIWISLLTACAIGFMVYIAVSLLLVRPIRRIIASIAAFRAAPERGQPMDPAALTVLAKDEMAVAARELAAMQAELRNALWRNARLAALGSAVARISHDLRGILAPALLAAERLQNHADPSVQRTGGLLLRTVDRATDLVRRTLDFAREGPPPLELAPVALALLVDEAGEAARASSRGFAVVNNVPLTLLVEADRNQFFRVLANLLRNAADAGARSVRVWAETRDDMAVIDVADDGPGLPEPVRATLFRPFARSTHHAGVGLGLAIARDLTLAHGGDIALAATGAAGTVFRLTLRIAAPDDGPDRRTIGSQEPVGSVAGIAPATQADL